MGVSLCTGNVIAGMWMLVFAWRMLLGLVDVVLHGASAFRCVIIMCMGVLAWERF